eukprot:1229067-Pyramimonas_sp.AAC.1
MRQIPQITHARWASLLARFPPDDENRRRGPPPFPVALLMGAVRELGAEPVIARRALVGNREADSTRTTMALSGPGA